MVSIHCHIHVKGSRVLTLSSHVIGYALTLISRAARPVVAGRAGRQGRRQENSAHRHGVR